MCKVPEVGAGKQGEWWAHLNKIRISFMILSLKKLSGTSKVIRRLDFGGGLAKTTPMMASVFLGASGSEARRLQ